MEDTNKPFDEPADEQLRFTFKNHELFSSDETNLYDDLRLYDPLATIALMPNLRPVPLMSYSEPMPAPNPDGITTYPLGATGADIECFSWSEKLTPSEFVNKYPEFANKPLGKPQIMSYNESSRDEFHHWGSMWKYQTFPTYWPLNFQFSANSDKDLQDDSVWHDPKTMHEERRRYLAELEKLPISELHRRDYNYAIMIPSKITGSPTIAQTLNESADQFPLRDIKDYDALWHAAQKEIPEFDGLIPWVQQQITEQKSNPGYYHGRPWVKKSVFDPVNNPLTLKMIRDIIQGLPTNRSVTTNPFYWNDKKMGAEVGDEVKVTLDINALIKEYVEKDQKPYGTLYDQLTCPELVDEMMTFANRYATMEQVRRMPYVAAIDPIKPGAASSVITVHSIHNKLDEEGEKLATYYQRIADEERRNFDEEIERLAAHYRADVLNEDIQHYNDTYYSEINNSPMQFYIRTPKGFYAVQWKGFNLSAFSDIGLLSVNEDNGNLTITMGNNPETDTQYIIALGSWMRLDDSNKHWRPCSDSFIRSQYQPHKFVTDGEDVSEPKHYVRQPRGKFAIQWKGYNLSDFVCLGLTLSVNYEKGILDLLFSLPAHKVTVGMQRWFVFIKDENGRLDHYETMSDEEFQDEYMPYIGDPQNAKYFYDKTRPCEGGNKVQNDPDDAGSKRIESIQNPGPDTYNQPMNKGVSKPGLDYGGITGGENITR
jgi:hypothetical protein